MARPLILAANSLLASLLAPLVAGCFHGHSYTPQHTVSTWREMQANVKQGREMILIAGSGRSTDAVLNIRDGSASSIDVLREIASQGRIIRFDIDESLEQFVQLLMRHI